MPRQSARTAELDRLKREILRLLEQRGPDKTICPSEVLEPQDKQDASRMRAVRDAANELVSSGEIEVVQRGVVVDASKARGPIRLRLR